MFEIAVVFLVVAGAAAFVGRSLYRSAMTRAKGCSCEDECPLSEKCNPDAGQCAASEPEKAVVRRSLHA